jgi:hypothetical protein
VFPELGPLAYHRSVLAHVRRTDRRSWESLLPSRSGGPGDPGGPGRPGGSGRGGPGGHDGGELVEELLRNTYRLDSHTALHAAGRRAADALGLPGPVEYFQAEGGGTANVTLLHQPDRAVLLFEGPLLDLLDEDELTAICGHELAHRRLWTIDGGAFLSFDGPRDAAEAAGPPPPQYLETARRWSMACELYADRGALIACGELRTAVGALLKASTGLSTVDPDAYLRQAGELDLSTGSRGTSHPEGVARAWALRGWLAGEDVEVLLTGPLDVDGPDLLDAALLREMAGVFAGHVAALPELRTEAVLLHAGGFFDPPVAEPPPPAGRLPRFDEPWPVRPVDGAPAPRPRRLSDATRKFLCYLLLDLATVDPETGDKGLVAAMTLARRTGLSEAYDDLADDELGWTDRYRTKLATAADRALSEAR